MFGLRDRADSAEEFHSASGPAASLIRSSSRPGDSAKTIPITHAFAPDVTSPFCAPIIPRPLLVHVARRL